MINKANAATRRFRIRMNHYFLVTKFNVAAMACVP